MKSFARPLAYPYQTGTRVIGRQAEFLDTVSAFGATFGQLGLAIAAVCVLLCFAGCRDVHSKVSSDESRSAIQQMQAHANAQQWPEAAALIERVLIENPDDPATLEIAAKAAFMSGQTKLAAELLVEACVVTQYKQEARIQQAFTGLISVGRLFEAIELLEHGVEAEPTNFGMRKLLHSFLLGTERHREAAKHAHVLVQQRNFDAELLKTLGDPARRTQEADSLVAMTERNPADLRPLIGKARFHLDRGQFSDCIKNLKRIVAQHPNDIVAQVMLGRAFVLAGQHEQLVDWSSKLPSGITGHADYWLTLGDWANTAGEPEIALEAYAQAAQRDFDQVQIWDKLASAMLQQDPSSADVGLVRKRAGLLSRLRQLQADREVLNDPSGASSIQIANVLAELGRLWEAEAWLSIGLTELSADAVDATAKINELRTSIVQRLSQQTPWQLEIPLQRWADKGLDENTAILAKLSGRTQSMVMSQDTRWTSFVTPLLVDEASERGLDFFGRTGDQLDKPGIRIHRSLGCGGGVLDYDRDGWPDLYLTTAGGTPPNLDSAPNALFRNRNGMFIDVASLSNCEDRGFSQGVAVGDVNADGFDDLLVLNYGPNHLWINNGDGTFTDASDRWLSEQKITTWSTSAAIADIDGDSIADAVVTNYAAGLSPSLVDCASEGVEGHRSCSPLFFSAEPDVFYKGQNRGGWQEANRTWMAHPEILGRGLGVVVGTFSPGRINDVYIANDMTSNHYWTKNDQASEFQLVESATIVGLANDALSRTQGSMGIATSDLNGDGVTDFYVTNFENEHNT
ncbi:FG-GAP-like repeat-containing protein, partial [Novipirellula maiorica]